MFINITKSSDFFQAQNKNIAKNPVILFPQTFSMVMEYLTLVYTHLKWAIDFLTYYPFYKLHDSHFPIIGEMYNICNYESIPDSEKDVECVVCLSKIEEGDDIRVLKCDHMYHRHCLDKWVAFKNHTCPLCRESLRPERVIIENHCREYYNPFSILGLDLSSPESVEVNHIDMCE